MKKANKILLAAATFFPLFYMVFLFFAAVLLLFFILREGADERANIRLFSLIVVPLHFLTIALSLGLTVFYAIKVSKNKFLARDKKVLWIVSIIIGNVVAMPVYWYLHVRRE